MNTTPKPTTDASQLISGTLAVARGGTGVASYAVGDIVYASGTTTLAKLADVATGSVLISGGVGVAPSWSASPTITKLNIATGTTNANAISFGGDFVMYRTTTNRVTIDNGSGTSNCLLICKQFRADASGTTLMVDNSRLGLGSSATITWNTNNDGTGGGDTRLARSTTKTLKLDDSAGGAADLIVVGSVAAASFKINSTAGASGNFTTTDGKTVTVSGGLITAIV